MCRQQTSAMAHCLVALLALGPLSCGPVPSSDAFAPWLGSQASDLRMPETNTKLEHYTVELEVVDAAHLDLPETANTIVTFVDGEFGRFDLSMTSEHARFLVGTLRLEASTGFRFYRVDARIASGLLAGAIVHFRDGRIQDSITDPALAVFPIPDDVRIVPGPVEFEVLGYSAI